MKEEDVKRIEKSGRNPELRFPEFEGEWIEEKLGKISQIRTGPFGSLLHEKDYVPEGTPIITVEHLSDFGIIQKNLPLVSDYDRSRLKSYSLEERDIVFSRVGSVDRNSFIRKEETGWLFSGRLLRIRTDSSKIDSKFLSYYFQLDFVKHRIRSVAVGQTMPSLNTQILNDFKVFHIKHIKEQQKIATFLTAIDQRIQFLQKKKVKLEEFKKGGMQKLFSQEVRFKDENGNDFPDWEEKKLGEIGNTFNGLTGKTKDDFGKGKPYVQYMQIFNNSKINIEGFGLVKIDEGENQSKVQYGDVFFTTSSETPNEIGTASVMLNEVADVYLNSFCFGFRPNSLSELVPEFSRYFFRSELFRREIIKLAQGSTRFNMSKVELMKLQVLIPNEDEQKKIAQFLTSLDASIESIGVEIDGTMAHKKGLLQKMFI